MSWSSDGSVIAARYDTLASNYLAPWAATGVSLSLVDEAHKRWGDYRDKHWGGYTPPEEAHNPLCRINVLARRLYYVPCAGARSKRRLARQRALLQLLSAVLDHHDVPDLDMAISIADRPTVPHEAVSPSGRQPPLVFGYATTPAHYTVPLPYVSFAPGSKWSSLFQRMAATGETRPARSQRAVWRGKCFSVCDGGSDDDRYLCVQRHPELQHRRHLVQAAAKCPDLVDAGLINANEISCHGLHRSAQLDMSQHATYAYHVHVDGNGFSGRLDELLTLGGTVLKQDSPFTAFYYPLLVRHAHFVPLRADLSDLCPAVAALRADPNRAARLAAAATNFTAGALAPSAVNSYVASLLRRYAALQRFTPSKHAKARAWDAAAAAAPTSAGAAPTRVGERAMQRARPKRRQQHRRIRTLNASTSTMPAPASEAMLAPASAAIVSIQVGNVGAAAPLVLGHRLQSLGSGASRLLYVADVNSSWAAALANWWSVRPLPRWTGSMGWEASGGRRCGGRHQRWTPRHMLAIMGKLLLFQPNVSSAAPGGRGDGGRHEQWLPNHMLAVMTKLFQPSASNRAGVGGSGGGGGHSISYELLLFLDSDVHVLSNPDVLIRIGLQMEAPLAAAHRTALCNGLCAAHEADISSPNAGVWLLRPSNASFHTLAERVAKTARCPRYPEQGIASLAFGSRLRWFSSQWNVRSPVPPMLAHAAAIYHFVGGLPKPHTLICKGSALPVSASKFDRRMYAAWRLALMACVHDLPARTRNELPSLSHSLSC